MKNAQTHSRYVDWLNADQMHKNSKEWLSELRFIKDEHLFFEDLIKSYTLDLLEPQKFVHNKEIIDKIKKFIYLKIKNQQSTKKCFVINLNKNIVIMD